MTTETIPAQAEILPRVRRCIVKSTGVAPDGVEPPRTLVHDMGVDSIDLIDMLFEIEREFGITLGVGDFERMARKITGDEPFAVDQRITPAGLRSLQILMPEIPREKFREGMSVPEIPLLVTVGTLCSMVERRLSEKAAGHA